MEALQRQAWVLGTSVFGNRLHVSVAEEKEGREKIAALLASAGLAVKRIDRILPTLEDVFIHLIEEKPGTSASPSSSFQIKKNPSSGLKA
jgi:ABC-2 type transport system ATP-binding protein